MCGPITVIPISILYLVPVILGETPREALRESLDLAQHAEEFGCTRYWVAEHDNMTAIASAAWHGRPAREVTRKMRVPL
jgi:hypothetical protein